MLSPAYVQAHQTRKPWRMLTATPVSPPPQHLTPVRILNAKLVPPFTPSALWSCRGSVNSKPPKRCWRRSTARRAR